MVNNYFSIVIIFIAFISHEFQRVYPFTITLIVVGTIGGIIAIFAAVAACQGLRMKCKSMKIVSNIYILNMTISDFMSSVIVRL